MAEATSPLADPMNEDRQWVYRAGVPMKDRDGDVVFVPITDFALKEQEDAKDRYRDALPKGMPMPNGLNWPVVKYPRARH